MHAAVEGVKYARDLCDDVEFSPEDASRTELEFLAEVVERAIEAGATTINVPDTVGYTVPEEFYEVFQYLQATRARHRARDPERALPQRPRHGGRQQPRRGAGRRAPGRVHDQRHRRARGQLLARGSRDGAQDARVVLRSHDRRRHAPAVPDQPPALEHHRASPIPRNKAVVGENAFAHEAGIHQHGMLKHHSTYEIMRPEDVGLSRTNLVLGKHSGRHAFRERVKELGFELDRDRARTARSTTSRRSRTRRRSFSTATSRHSCSRPS